MKLNLLIATAAAAVVCGVAGAGSAFAATYNMSAGTPTLSGGDDAYVDAVVGRNDSFTNTYTFDLSAVGSITDVYTTINLIPRVGGPSVTGLSASFYDLTTGKAVGVVAGGNGSIALADNSDYAVTVSGQTSKNYGGSYSLDLLTSVAPVPGPAGFLIAIGGMGALLLKRRRASDSLAA